MGAEPGPGSGKERASARPALEIPSEMPLCLVPT